MALLSVKNSEKVIKLFRFYWKPFKLQLLYNGIPCVRSSVLKHLLLFLDMCDEEDIRQPQQKRERFFIKWGLFRFMFNINISSKYLVCVFISYFFLLYFSCISIRNSLMSTVILFPKKKNENVNYDLACRTV